METNNDNGSAFDLRDFATFIRYQVLKALDEKVCGFRTLRERSGLHLYDASAAQREFAMLEREGLIRKDGIRYCATDRGIAAYAEMREQIKKNA
jgi:hypothetical protein